MWVLSTVLAVARWLLPVPLYYALVVARLFVVRSFWLTTPLPGPQSRAW